MYRYNLQLQIVRLSDDQIVPDNNPALVAWCLAGNKILPPLREAEPDWRSFLADLKTTSAFTVLQTAASQALNINAVATELRLLLGEAALGNPDPAGIQALLPAVASVLTPVQLQEIATAITQWHIPLELPG